MPRPIPIYNFISNGISEVENIFHPSPDALARFANIWTAHTLRTVMSYINPDSLILQPNEVNTYDEQEKTVRTDNMTNAVILSGISTKDQLPNEYHNIDFAILIDNNTINEARFLFEQLMKDANFSATYEELYGISTNTIPSDTVRKQL
jgi:hypothetical protein